MTKLVDMVGATFGRVTVVARAANEASGQARWSCLCSCGKEFTAGGSNLRGGRTRSCGCATKEALDRARVVHGEHGTLTYKRWKAMKERCYGKRSIGYKNYGGRGIAVCDRWRESFSAFLEDMGPVPDGWQLDRIDNDGNYEPSNCRWVPQLVNANNRRNNRLVEFDGKKMTIAAWARETGLSQEAIRQRLNANWPVERALTSPDCKYGPHLPVNAV